LKDGNEYNEAIKECHTRAGERMVKACILNGGMYVKLGQAISTMNEIMPKELCAKLRSLQSEALRSEGNNVS
jgi:aarF domain-containing kinase